MMAQRRGEGIRQISPFLLLDQPAKEGHVLPLAGLRLRRPADCLQKQAMVTQGRCEMRGELDPLLGLDQPAQDRHALAPALFRLAEPSRAFAAHRHGC